MSLGSIFKNVYDRITAQIRKNNLERARSDGGSLGSAPASSAGSFEPIKREAPAAPHSPGDAPEPGRAETT